MKIYTKQGDTGDTSLFGGERRSKDDLRISAYGTVDELNAHIGVVRSLQPPAPIDSHLEKLQHILFTLGNDIAAPQNTIPIRRIQKIDYEIFEHAIDEIDALVPPLRNFILPAGTPVATALHVARTVCRRAERLVVALGKKEALNAECVVFLNRLSDFLFVLARYANHLSGTADTIWKK